MFLCQLDSGSAQRFRSQPPNSNLSHLSPPLQAGRIVLSVLFFLGPRQHQEVRIQQLDVPRVRQTSKEFSEVGLSRSLSPSSNRARQTSKEIGDFGTTSVLTRMSTGGTNLRKWWDGTCNASKWLNFFVAGAVLLKHPLQNR